MGSGGSFNIFIIMGFFYQIIKSSIIVVQVIENESPCTCNFPQIFLLAFSMHIK